LHYEFGDFKKSADYQGEAVNILQKVLQGWFRCSQLMTIGIQTQ
jgi:hypothetical protein